MFDQIDLLPLPGPSIYDPMRYHALSFTADGSAWATGGAGQTRVDPSGAVALIAPTYSWGANDAVVSSDGTLWIAHDLGLRRRDPLTFALTQVNTMWINHLEWEPAGALWLVQYNFTALNVVHRMTPSTGAVTTFPLGGTALTAVFANNAMWVLVRVGNFFTGRLVVVRIAPSGEMTHFSVEEVGALVPSTNGGLWVIGRTTMTRLTPTTGESASFRSPIPQTWGDDSEARGLSFAAAPDGAVWIVHRGGLARLEGETLTNYPTPTLPPGGSFRPSYRPGASFGPDGRLWFIDRYVICCSILPGITFPSPPFAVIRRVNVAALSGGQTFHLSNADVPVLSSIGTAALTFLLASLAASVILRMK